VVLGFEVEMVESLALIVEKKTMNLHPQSRMSRQEDRLLE